MMESPNLRHRTQQSLLTLKKGDDNDHNNMDGNRHGSIHDRCPRNHWKRKRPVANSSVSCNDNNNANSCYRKKWQRRLAVGLGLWLVYRWGTQWMDAVRDGHRLRERRERAQVGDLAWIHDIPVIPSRNWPVMARWPFRPHNARIVHTARLAISEMAQDLRRHLSSKSGEDPWGSVESQDWLHQRAPWMKGYPAPQWPHSALPTLVDDKAIVVSAGDKQLRYLKTLVHTIRHIHQSEMAIRVVYRDDKDLTPSGQEEIRTVSDTNIHFINLSHYFDLDAVGLRGWNLKALGMLAVPESELMVLDADVMLLQAPEIIFQQEGYVRTGALFFHDRLKPQFYWNVHVLAEWLNPNLPERVRKLLTYGHSPRTSYYSEQIQEAGLILLDKRQKMMGLWSACLIFGRPDLRQYIQTDHMYGDKEVYWLAMETIQEPYEFATYYPGVLGGTFTDFGSSTTHLSLDAETQEIDDAHRTAINTQQALCGRLLHFDDAGKPLWANGGYMLKEDDWSSRSEISQLAINPVFYLDGGAQGETFPNPWMPFFRNLLQFTSLMRGENQVWALHRSMGVECLSPNARGMQLVDHLVAEIGRQAVHHYFEQNTTEREDLHGNNTV